MNYSVYLSEMFEKLLLDIGYYKVNLRNFFVYLNH